MVRKTRFFLIVTFCSLITASVEAGDNASVTYIANEGFLLESGDKKVLIDALFGKQDLDFCDVPPPATLDKMIAAEPPFDKVDLVLITHDHIDHFDPDLVASYLEANPQSQIIGTQQVADTLKSAIQDEKLKARIHAVTPPFGSSETLSLNGIDISVLRLKHNAYFEIDEKTNEKVDLHRNEENIGFLIKMGKTKILHIGDSPMDNFREYQEFHLEQEEIDAAFLGSLFWPPLEPRFEIVNKYIKPNTIILMHLRKNNKEKYLPLVEAYRGKLVAPITIFITSLENKLFDKQ